MRLRLLAPLLLLPLTACDLEKTGNQLLAEEAMVGFVLSTPPVALSPADVAGGPDAGSFDAGTVTVPGSTYAFVFLGTREGTGLSAPPTPITDATVRLEVANAAAVALPAHGSGVYSLESSSSESGGLAYTSGATYDFVAEAGGERYLGRVENAPALESIPELHPSGGLVRLAAGQELVLTRAPVPAGTERTLGFVTVFPVSAGGERLSPTYSNVPTSPLDFLVKLANPAQFRTEKVTVPGSAFPAAASTYVVALQAVRTGGAESDNLFAGSVLLAGTADQGVVRTE